MRTLRAIPLPILLVLLSLICPSELSLFVGGLRLPPHRVALIVLTVTAIVRIARGSPIRFMTCDYLFLAYALWTLGVFIYHEGEGAGLQFGGSLALESFASYFVARVYVTRLAHLEATLRVLLIMVAVAGMVAVGESLASTHWLHDWLGHITGYQIETGIEYRRGLLRAYSTFDHPIHYGTFCASVLALTWAAAPRLWTAIWQALLVVGAAFLSLSSAPMLTLVLQIGLGFWDRLSRAIPHRVALSVLGGLAALILVGIVSNRSPAAIIATGFTLDAWTGFYRLVIWEQGLLNVGNSPMLGLGLADWTREWWMVSDSVDAFWLVIMMRMGVPALALLIAAIGFLVAAIHRQRRGSTAKLRRFALAWTISLVALSLAGCTVHYWNAIHAYFFFFLGLLAWVGDGKLAAQRARALAAPSRLRRASEPPTVRPELAFKTMRHPASPGQRPRWNNSDVGINWT